MKKLLVVISLLVMASMLLSACAPGADDVAEVGTEDNPVKVIFVPSVDTTVIVTGGEIMADALQEATGLYFEVVVPTSYAAAIEEMCASPTNTMTFIPPLGYALASAQCGVDVAFKAVRYGFPVYWAEYIVQRDSSYQTLADLEGATWGFGHTGSTSGYMLPLVDLEAAGITTGDKVETGGHNQTVSAVYNGQVDFGTVFYSVPIDADYNSLFTYDEYVAGSVTTLEQYLIPQDSVENCAVTDDGKKILCDGLRILDARANIRTDAPDVIQKVRILAISTDVPNDAMAFGPDFPADLRTQIVDALYAFSLTEAWDDSIGNADFYNWSGIIAATDAEYDDVRMMVELSGFTIEP
jgi:phosphonate transport system substrate-binding protein